MWPVERILFLVVFVEQNHIPSNNLSAVELLGGKVYFMINKFPIDSGIRIPPNEVYTISLGQWEHLGTIDNFFRYFIYLPHNYNNYLKMPKEKKKL